MIALLLQGKLLRLEFREFTQWVRDGRVPAEALVSGDVLTGGEAVRARELRTFAILRGLPLPPPRHIPLDPDQPNLDTTLARVRWEPAIDLSAPSRPRTMR